MTKLKIKVISWGQLPFKFDRSKIENWKSDIFEIVGAIETHQINKGSDGEFHEYYDQTVLDDMPDPDCDFMVAMTNVPLENNWYSRRLADKIVCFSFFELADILRPNNIPLENLVFRLLYAYSLIYKRFRNRLPSSTEPTNFTHADTRQCLFDFNGIKSEIIFSTVKPTLCDECYFKLQQEKVSKETLETIRKELKKVDRPFYYRLTDFFKEKPFIAFGLSALLAIFLGIVGSVIYDTWIKELIK
ncbi:hypothetical protein JMN32_18365 [Fulvivirga sp. 29W222]|uniref:Uncharacterized protein n=1 Tax=Fulvivirga marina TaxID=2494733 RepID=A0A937FY53_9BACT|nr:hypothetical protein [Fulvivirga marina]MBL6448285.1 hypothetical protein [Fulvivirga marina]